jgi:selenophosphate synthase
MAEPSPEFWANVRAFREMGMDPLKWIAGCSVEVDREDVVVPALAGIGSALEALGVTLHGPEGPDAVEFSGEAPPLRRVVVLGAHLAGGERDGLRGNPNRASAVLRVFQKRADDPKLFGDFVRKAIEGLPLAAGPADRESLRRPLVLGKMHAVATPHENGEFALFEVLSPSHGRAEGRFVVNSDTLQITDASEAPGAALHVAAACSSALSPLFALGCHEELSLSPIFDAPTQETRQTIADHFPNFAKAQGIALRPQAPVGPGRLLLGATATAISRRELPNRHHYVKRGMQVTVTRAFGDLSPLAVRLSCLSDPDHLQRAQESGLTMTALDAAARTSTAALSSPARPVGEVISQFCPPFGEPPELAEHLAATVDLAGRGILALADFAKRWEAELRLTAIPLLHPEIAAFATSAFLMDNATAGAPGAVAIVAWPTVLDAIEHQLRAKGVAPHRVGEIVARGEARLRVPAAARGAVASKRLLRSLAIDEPA